MSLLLLTPIKIRFNLTAVVSRDMQVTKGQHSVADNSTIYLVSLRTLPRKTDPSMLFTRSLNTTGSRFGFSWLVIPLTITNIS